MRLINKTQCTDLVWSLIKAKEKEKQKWGL
jgi:hypothetical protein